MDNAKTAEQIFDQSKDAIVRCQIDRQINQHVLLIWLDSNIDESDADCCNKMAQFRRAVNTIDTYTNVEQCVQFIKTIENDKVCMVISDYLGEDIVPRVHDMSQVDSIFIWYADSECHTEWTKDWHKIKGVFTEISPICEALMQAAQQCEQNAISMSFMATSEDLSKKKLDQLDPCFMYTQILKEILLKIEFEQKHFTEFIEYCREMFNKNPDELKSIKQIQRYYYDQPPIYWYTLKCFLYSMLNRSLRLMNVNNIIRMGFFIAALHRDIDRLQQEQYGSQNSGEGFTVYRGQGITKNEFDQMSKTMGGLLSFNNFLSTSKDKTVSLNFANDALKNPDLVGVLFVMMIDPSQSTIPFASIGEVSYYGSEEDEVLFGMHSVFRIHNIQDMDGNHRLYQVDLELTNDSDKDLQQLTDRIREEIEASVGWDQLGNLLIKIGEPVKAEQVYNILLNQTTEEIEKAYIYFQMAWAKYSQGDYKEALTFCEKSVKIRQQLLPSNHPHLAKSYSHSGVMYHSMGEHSKALSFHEKALTIREKSLLPNHPDLAASYNNIGTVYFDMGEYSKALLYYEKSLDIDKQSLPPNHPDLAISYNNIGAVYSVMGEYSKTLKYYEKALVIREQSLPPNHPDLAISYHNIGTAYNSMNEYLKALTYYDKNLEITQISLPPLHPHLAKSYGSIGSVYSDMGEYSKALSYYEKALAIREQSLTQNDLDLASSYNKIGTVYSSMDEYSKALLYYEKALPYYEKNLEMAQKSLPPNHPDLAKSYSNIGAVYSDMGDYSKALTYYEKALGIREQSLPPNHPDLASTYNDIGAVYYNTEEYSEALMYYEKALIFREKSLSLNHPDLAKSYNNIGWVHSYMGEHPKALLCFENSLNIDKNTLPLNHPDLAKSYSNIGAVYSDMDEYSKALPYYEKALAIREHSLPPDRSKLATTYNNIGAVCHNMDEYFKALTYYKKALAILQQLLPSNHLDLASSYNSIGAVYSDMGENSEAVSHYEKALAIQQESLPPDHPDLITSYDNISNVYSDMGEDAAKTGEQSLPSDHK